MVLACPGHVNACNGLPNETNPAAEEGTAAHELAEAALNLGMRPHDFIGKTFNGFEVTDTMADYVEVYTNHVRSLRVRHPNGLSLVEGKVRMSSVAPDVFGTSDHILIATADRTLYIDDLKFGWGVVEEEDNPQTAHYAVSTLDTHNLWFSIDKIVCTIVQPRADHIKGVIRSVTYTIDELQQWRSEFAEGIRKARNLDAERIAGPHCKYCRAAGTCRQRAIRTVFIATLDAPIQNMSDEEVNNLLREIPTITRHLEAVQKHADVLARGGKQYKDFKLVRARTHAKCKDEEAFVAEAGVERDKLYHPGKLKGKTELSKIVDKDIVDKHFEKAESKTTLVPLTHSSAAVVADARGVFPEVD